MNKPDDFDLDLGDGHWLKWTAYEGDPHAGAQVPHTTATGLLCNGFISFQDHTWAKEFNHEIPTWVIECVEPLTLSPSILCRGCGDHGFIRDGKWVRA